MIVLLPNLANKAIPPKVVKKLTNPTMPVIVVALNPPLSFGSELLNTVLE